MDGPKQIQLLREMQTGLDEEVKDISRKLDALAELVIEMLQALPLAPDRKERVMAAMAKLVEAQKASAEDAAKRAARYRQILTELDGEGSRSSPGASSTPPSKGAGKT